MRSSLKWARVSFYVLLLHIAFTITVILAYYNHHQNKHTIQGEMIIPIFVDGIHHVVFFNRTLSACCRTQYVCSSFIRSFVCNLSCTPTAWWKVVSQHYVIYTCVCASVLTALPQSYQCVLFMHSSKLKCAHFISRWLRWHIKCCREYNTPRRSAMHKIIIIYEVFVVAQVLLWLDDPLTPIGRVLQRFRFLGYTIYWAFLNIAIQNHNFLL